MEAYAKAIVQSDVFFGNDQLNELQNLVNVVRRDNDGIVDEVIKNITSLHTQRKATL